MFNLDHGEEDSLFSEMVLFQELDCDGSASIEEDEFVSKLQAIDFKLGEHKNLEKIIEMCQLMIENPGLSSVRSSRRLSTTFVPQEDEVVEKPEEPRPADFTLTQAKKRGLLKRRSQLWSQYEIRARASAIFTVLDSDKSGDIKPTEMVEKLRMFNLDHGEEDSLFSEMVLFQELDCDGSASIEEDEFVSKLQAIDFKLGEHKNLEKIIEMCQLMIENPGLSSVRSSRRLSQITLDKEAVDPPVTDRIENGNCLLDAKSNENEEAHTEPIETHTEITLHKEALDPPATDGNENGSHTMNTNDDNIEHSKTEMTGSALDSAPEPLKLDQREDHDDQSPNTDTVKSNDSVELSKTEMTGSALDSAPEPLKLDHCEDHDDRSPDTVKDNIAPKIDNHESIVSSIPTEGSIEENMLVSKKGETIDHTPKKENDEQQAPHCGEKSPEEVIVNGEEQLSRKKSKWSPSEVKKNTQQVFKMLDENDLGSIKLAALLNKIQEVRKKLGKNNSSKWAHFTINRANGLMACNSRSKISHPYVKIKVGSTRKVGKTRAIIKDLNPVWNEVIDFEIKADEPHHLELSVWNSLKYGKNSPMGSVTLELSRLKEVSSEFDLQLQPCAGASKATGTLKLSGWLEDIFLRQIKALSTDGENIFEKDFSRFLSESDDEIGEIIAQVCTEIHESLDEPGEEL